MDSQTQIPQIPVIDFSSENFKNGSSSWLSMCNQIRYALEDYGCFVAKYDRLSPQLSAKLSSQAKHMFDLPTETKKKNTSDEPFRGYYTRKHEMPPLREGMGIDNARFVEQTQKFTNLMWPHGNDQFCEVVNSYAKILGDLNELVLEMVFQSYGAGKHYASFAASISHVLRFLKFKLRDTESKSIRLPAHKDLSFVTIVHQIDNPGLEVETNDGTWIAIEPDVSHFVFLACEGMQVWSNDRVKACKHRVNISGDKDRYSMGLFTFNNGVIQVPEEMVDDEHPLLYNPFDHPEFVRFFTRSVMTSHDPVKKQFDNPLKAFCGV
ncbi:deoxypodophyllotoxin synthase-like [Ziziphus jujuba]|uniref:Deoxypodophyllotoxin synthase-like n=1 Tax=Ziziphus jujuba TaxID=326968 RepID=A0ABM4A295_ZIZJJ|nr:deoxypodophyllotoxin synthase-like [Ziziphus jujuba]